MGKNYYLFIFSFLGTSDNHYQIMPTSLFTIGGSAGQAGRAAEEQVLLASS